MVVYFECWYTVDKHKTKFQNDDSIIIQSFWCLYIKVEQLSIKQNRNCCDFQYGLQNINRLEHSARPACCRHVSRAPRIYGRLG